MLTLQPADLVFVQGRGWISRAVMRWQRSKAEGPAPVSHVAMVVDRGGAIVEANSTGVELKHLIKRYGDGQTRVAIYRAKNISASVKKAIVQDALEHVGHRYGYGAIGLHLIDNAVFGGKYWARRLPVFGDICSKLVARAYSKHECHFGTVPNEAEPDDMWRFVNAETDKYTCVFPLGVLPSA